MEKGYKIAALGIGLVALVYLSKKGMDLIDSSDLISLDATAGTPSMSGTNVNVPINIKILNRTSNKVDLQIPSVQIIYKGKVLGDIEPNGKTTTILPNATTSIPTQNLKLSLTSLMSAGVDAISLVTSKGVNELKKQVTIRVRVVINGFTTKFDQKLSGLDGGLGLVSYANRKIGSKSDYAHLIAPLGSLDNVATELTDNGNIDDTLEYMKQIVRKDYKDTKELAKTLKGKDLKDTLNNVFKFVFKYIKYEPDSKLAEQIRRPLRTLHDQKGDCDCYSILIGSILYNLGIKFKFRVTAYYNRSYFQHVYVIVPRPEGGYYTVDPVVDSFNYEKPFTNKKDYEL